MEGQGEEGGEDTSEREGDYGGERKGVLSRSEEGESAMKRELPRMRWKVKGCGNGVREDSSRGREERQGMTLGHGEAIRVQAIVCGEGCCDIGEGKGVFSGSKEGEGSTTEERECVLLRKCSLKIAYKPLVRERYCY